MSRVYLCPCLNHREYFGGSQVGKGKVVSRRECNHIAFTSDGVRTEEEIREVYAGSALNCGIGQAVE